MKIVEKLKTKTCEKERNEIPPVSETFSFCFFFFAIPWRFIEEENCCSNKTCGIYFRIWSDSASLREFLFAKWKEDLWTSGKTNFCRELIVSRSRFSLLIKMKEKLLWKILLKGKSRCMRERREEEKSHELIIDFCDFQNKNLEFTSKLDVGR